VFDPRSGTLMDEPCIETIYSLRQLTLMFGKIALPKITENGNPLEGRDRQVVTPRRERQALLGFVQCEQDIRASAAAMDPLERERFKQICDVLYGPLFAKLDRDIYWGRTVPRHGPGAVSEKLSSNAKWNQRTWTTRLQGVFPWEEFLIPNPRYKEEKEQELHVLEPGAEIPVRVISVPKTLKTPRIIAIEPAAMQYVQQGLYRAFLKAWKEDRYLSRMLGFDDQDPNRELARSGSLSGDLATLDLSEASDRVLNQHVLDMTEGFPHLSAAIQACRSRKADVPGFGVLRLAKFASMGSALCFPVEAMVFLAVILLGINRESSVPLTRRSLKGYVGRVRVFGDDLIVPSDHVLSVVNELDVFGHRVNVSKSFWTGKFRESCGREYYNGEDVSIVRVREVLPTRRQNVREIVSAVSLRNQFYWAGLWQSARWMDDHLRKCIKHFPTVAPTSPLLGRESALGYEFQKLDPNLHSPLTKGYYVQAKPEEDNLNGPGALLKCLLRNEPEMGSFALDDPMPKSNGEPSVDSEHLERSGRPEHVSIKLGWRPPH